VTDTPRVAAFFDLDGTLADSNAVRSFLWLALAERGRLGRVLAFARFTVPLSACVVCDRLSRRLFNRLFYRLYRALPPERVRRLARRCGEATIASRVFPDMAARVEEHRARGEDVVIVTGALDVLVAPLAERLGAAAIVAVTLEERDGRFTGRLLRDAVRDGKDAALREIAAARGYDLAGCSAYADHASDLPFLLAVGRPAPTRPGRRLRHEARARGWPVIEAAPRGAPLGTPSASGSA
jgi:HAD superfamily hydrolase (TIGR01490 family)